MTRRYLRASALLVGMSLVAAACGTRGPGRLEFGIRRMALDIAFIDEDASPPADPQVVVRLVPAPAEVLAPGFDFSTVQVEPDEPEAERPVEEDPPEPPSFGLCPSASPDQTIGVSASPSVIDPPASGTYPRSNSGLIGIQGAGLPIRLPYPLFTAWKISAATKKLRPGPFGTAGSVAPATQFTVTKSLGPTYTVTETFEIGAEALLLLERVTVVNGVTTKFRTDPPIDFFRYGAEGDDWTSAGADTENGFGVVVQGRITDRTVIDVCGTLVDTFKINYTEQVVNLDSGETSGTNNSEPSTIYLAPQFGGLVVKEEMHTIQRTSAPDGSPVVIRFDYVSTLSSVEPVNS